MFHRNNLALASDKKKAPNKLIAGFAALAATAVIATTGMAAAATNDMPSKQSCKKAGFTNYGQCVKEWKHQKNHPGSGYGGGGNNNSVAVNLELDHSNNNVFQVIVNIFN
ncbi:MAG TPA: hypothetical protein VMY99_03300 [Nevskiaceae bacterium]|nr:hypothetical protein [Nevskiaceae bacterium]